jgi:hypothetical protein
MENSYGVRCGAGSADAETPHGIRSHGMWTSSTPFHSLIGVAQDFAVPTFREEDK